MEVLDYVRDALELSQIDVIIAVNAISAY